MITLSAGFISWKVKQIADMFETEVERARRNDVRSSLNRLLVRELHNLEADLPPEEETPLGKREAEVSMKELLDDLQEVSDEN